MRPSRPEERLAVGLRLFAQRLHHRRDSGAAHGVGPQHHPVRQQFREVLRQQPDQVRMQVCGEHGRKPIPAPARVASTWTKTLVELSPSRMAGTSRRGASRSST